MTDYKAQSFPQIDGRKTRGPEDGKTFPLLTVDDLVTQFGIAAVTWARYRRLGNGPRYLKLGPRVFYRREDVQSWMDSCLVASTAEQREVTRVYRAKVRSIIDASRARAGSVDKTPA